MALTQNRKRKKRFVDWADGIQSLQCARRWVGTGALDTISSVVVFLIEAPVRQERQGGVDPAGPN